MKHFLQEHKKPVLVLIAAEDSIFDIRSYSSLLTERIGYENHEDTGKLTLKDKLTNEELVVADILSEDKVSGLELGSISEFVLGPQIYLRVTPGYYEGGDATAQYEAMPALDAEVILSEEEGDIQYSLGAIRAAGL